MKSRCFILAILLLWSSFSVFAQTEEAKVKTKKFSKTFDLRFENGAMLGNNTEFSQQVVDASYYNGADIRLGFRNANADDIYSNVYRRPYFGVGLYTSTFHNADIGNPGAVYFFLTIPLKFEGLKKWSFSYSGAFGLSYKFNPYDPIKNPTNVFVGSYKNCYVHLAFVANYKFNDRWSANGSFGFKHFSNGSFKQPNYGLNLIPVTVGVSYKMDKVEIVKEGRPIPKFERHNLMNVALGVGSKNYQVGGDNYLKSTLTIDFLRQINYKYRIGAGLDIFYSDKSNYRNKSDQSDFSKSYTYALTGSWEWALTEKLYVPIAIGFYLHRNEENDEKTVYYERVGMRYRITDHFFAGVTIKAHGGAADYFEWAVGYTIY